jgi:hypothetical protein
VLTPRVRACLLLVQEGRIVRSSFTDVRVRSVGGFAFVCNWFSDSPSGRTVRTEVSDGLLGLCWRGVFLVGSGAIFGQSVPTSRAVRLALTDGP